MTRILTMNRKQIINLLKNHTLFSADEVKLAAKMKVQLDKEPTAIERQYASLQNLGMSGGTGLQQHYYNRQQSILDGFW